MAHCEQATVVFSYRNFSKLFHDNKIIRNFAEK